MINSKLIVISASPVRIIINITNRIIVKSDIFPVINDFGSIISIPLPIPDSIIPKNKNDHGLLRVFALSIDT
jgi:hypothetical protein